MTQKKIEETGKGRRRKGKPTDKFFVLELIKR